MQARKSARDDVVGICQAPEFVEIFSRESGNDRRNTCVSHGIGEAIIVCFQKQAGEQNQTLIGVFCAVHSFELQVLSY
jgi:hypothetical protein